MLIPWLALESGADPAERARAVRRAHETFLADGTVSAPVRHVFADSWRRCAGAGVAPDGIARVVLTEGDLAAHRAAHPLAPVLPLLRELLRTRWPSSGRPRGPPRGSSPRGPRRSAATTSASSAATRRSCPAPPPDRSASAAGTARS
ncbi:hypothetical protein [Streptomyces sp. GSL17-111]|uniref:hypothetical protein n=1 Tax=Streptomyces sp. GSL17-111 TaxID=3121596 RepID=UPI0030F37C30